MRKVQSRGIVALRIGRKIFRRRIFFGDSVWRQSRRTVRRFHSQPFIFEKISSEGGPPARTASGASWSVDTCRFAYSLFHFHLDFITSRAEARSFSQLQRILTFLSCCSQDHPLHVVSRRLSFEKVVGAFLVQSPASMAVENSS